MVGDFFMKWAKIRVSGIFSVLIFMTNDSENRNSLSIKTIICALSQVLPLRFVGFGPAPLAVALRLSGWLEL